MAKLFKNKAIKIGKCIFLHRVDGLILRDRVRSADIQEEPGVKSVLPCIEEPDEVVRKPLRCLLPEVSNWEETPGQILALAHWRDYISWLVWECLGVPPGRARGGGWGAECLGPVTQNPISGKRLKRHIKRRSSQLFKWNIWSLLWG